MSDLRNLKCVECEQTEEDMLVFVGNLRYEDGTIEDLQEGMHPYCVPCREKLNISDELNAGRDLRAETKQVTLDAVKAAKEIEDPDGRDKGISLIMETLDPWVGGTDSIFGALGRRIPERPQEIFDGVSDALAEIDPTAMKPTHALGLITTINTTRDRIENWGPFVERTYEHFKKVMGEDQARRIMAGFI